MIEEENNDHNDQETMTSSLRFSKRGGSKQQGSPCHGR